MLFDPDPVTDSVDERLAITGRDDRITAGTIDLFTRPPDPRRRDRGGLRETQDLV